MPLLTFEDGICAAKATAGDTHLGDENWQLFKMSTTLTHHLEHVLAGISLGKSGGGPVQALLVWAPVQLISPA